MGATRRLRNKVREGRYPLRETIRRQHVLLMQCHEQNEMLREQVAEMLMGGEQPQPSDADTAAAD